MASNAAVYERRRRFASQFGVPHGGRYRADWAERIDAILEEYEAQSRRLLGLIEKYDGWDCPNPDCQRRPA